MAAERPLLAVIAFGGNALLRRGEELSMGAQRAHAREAAAAVARLVAETRCRVVVTHGNGPQVGLLAAQRGADAGLDVLDAETEGQIGFVLETELANALGPSAEVATLLTQVVVDPDDATFQHPTKQVGRWFEKAEAEALAAEHGWALARAGDRWRRAVASPPPLEIVELKALRALVAAGVTTVCCGGGGIPVTRGGAAGARRGVECVVDKDLSSSLLACRLAADWLIILGDEATVLDPAAYARGERAPLPSLLRVADASALREHFEAGSMRPKVQAACEFVAARGGAGRAAIGAMDSLLEIVRDGAGTHFVL
jgi:carbamate kinase